MKRKEFDQALMHMKLDKLWIASPLKREGAGSKEIKINCCGCITGREAFTIEIFKDHMNATFQKVF